MATSKKNNDKKKNVVVVRGGGINNKTVSKSASQARSRASKSGTPVGPTRAYGEYVNGKMRTQSNTTVYSRGGTGKGTTGKRSVVTEVKQINVGRPDKRTTTSSRKLYQPKSTNKPGPWDDIARAGGAVKRTVYSNPGNKNKASNIDKWLKGGTYGEGDKWRNPSSVDIAKAVGKGAKAVGEYVASPSRWVGTKAVKAVVNSTRSKPKPKPKPKPVSRSVSPRKK